MDLKLEMFVLGIILMSIMESLRCSYRGSGNQLMMIQGAGHWRIQKLCVDSLGIQVSHFYYSAFDISEPHLYKCKTHFIKNVEGCRDGIAKN